jgi:hypothetical protein
MLLRVGWILLGVAIGIGLSSLPTVKAQASTARVVFRPASSNMDGQIGFIHDTRTGGCWLLAGAAGIASAPTTACK